MKYIDADALIQHIKDVPTWREMLGIGWRSTRYPDGMYDCDDIINSVENAPTAEVVEVRRGEWIWTENGKEDYEQYWVCSVCKEKTYFETKFCSECGAKMDKGVMV